MARHTLRRILNDLNGSTFLGLLIARIGQAKLRRGPDGLTLAEGYRPRFPVAGAFTVGNVVITARAFDSLKSRNPEIITHEARHATQYALLGWLFLPLYVLGMGFSWVRTGDRAAGHPLEIWAGLSDGGYRRLPSRTLKACVDQVRVAVRRNLSDVP